MELFPDDEWSENENVDRSSVLEKDRVRSGCMLGRPYEQEQQRRIDQRACKAKKIDPETIFPSGDQDGYSSEQGAIECHLVGVERRQLDKKTTRAPQEHGDHDIPDRCSLPAGFHWRLV